jgi:4-hydroxy-tetrahydrodipicolinate reductase
MRVAVIGSNGNMGRAVVEAVSAAPDLDLGPTIDLGDDLSDVAQADVAVIFTTPDAALPAIEAAVGAGVHCVVGTTGIDAGQLDVIRQRCAANPGVGVAIVPNFAIGAVLMMEFSRRAAEHFASVEIVEEHHPGKLDAPSGTAIRTAELIGEVRSSVGKDDMPDATQSELAGARGSNVAGVPVHSIRLPGRVAHQSVVFGNPGETLTLRHDSSDRSSFMPGVLLTVRAIGAHPGVTIGLEPFLGFSTE